MSRTAFGLCFAAVGLLAVLGTTRQVLAAEEKAKEKVELKVGDQAPEFESTDDTGQPWKSVEHVGKKVLVVYFYPKDQTPGCTKQACSYRDSQGKLEDMGVEVVGVSRDTVESHVAFKDKEKLNFTLLADPIGAVSEAFGVDPMMRGVLEMNSRWTFVIDKEGHIAYADHKVDPVKDVENIMKVVDELNKAEKDKAAKEKKESEK